MPHALLLMLSLLSSAMPSLSMDNPFAADSSSVMNDLPDLSSYGASDLREPSATNTARKLTNATIAVDDSTYYLSSGDLLRLRWWGTGSGSVELSVDGRGNLIIPDIGVISTKAKNLGQIRDSVEKLLKSRRKARLVDLQVIAMGLAQVRVVGLVPKPGVQELNPGTRLSQFLIEAGLNPSKQADWLANNGLPAGDELVRLPSLRRVLVIRKSGDSLYCDLLKAERSGDVRQDPPLFQGDMVKVQEVQHALFVSGNHPKPGSYELIPGETVASFWSATGGDPIQGAVQVLSRDGSRKTATATEQLTPQHSAVQVQGLARMTPVRVAWVLGSVAAPGAYPITSGIKASELVAQAGKLPMTNPQSVVAIRKNWNRLQPSRRLNLTTTLGVPEVQQVMQEYALLTKGAYADEDPVVEAGDTVWVREVDPVVWVGGRVKRPGFVKWRAGATLDDYIALAGGLGERGWKKRAVVYDLTTGQRRDRDVPIQAGAGVHVPENSYISPKEWIQISTSIVIALASAVGTGISLYMVVRD